MYWKPAEEIIEPFTGLFKLKKTLSSWIFGNHKYEPFPYHRLRLTSKISKFTQDVLYLAVSYFELEEYEKANQYFSSYLKKQMTPKFFEEAFMYK